MNLELDPKALYWAQTSSGRCEFRILGQAVMAIAQSGANDEAVALWGPVVKAQCEADNFPHKPTPDNIRKDLKEFGAWDENELKDDEANWARLLWTCAWDIAESGEPDCSEPRKA